jgi:hypothetical protein
MLGSRDNLPSLAARCRSTQPTVFWAIACLALQIGLGKFAELGKLSRLEKDSTVVKLCWLFGQNNVNTELVFRCQKPDVRYKRTFVSAKPEFIAKQFQRIREINSSRE